MKWSTLILVVIVLVSVVGIAFFVFPWDWADDVQTSWNCGDTSYVYKKSASLSIETWYDPTVPNFARRIVYEPFSEDGEDWHFFDIGFGTQENTAEQLRKLVWFNHEQGEISHESWHWFDCTMQDIEDPATPGFESVSIILAVVLVTLGYAYSRRGARK